MNGAINERVGLLLVPRYNSGTKKQRNMREGLYIADKKSVFQYLEKSKSTENILIGPKL